MKIMLMLTKFLINKFHEKICFGSEYICTRCDQLWYKSYHRLLNAMQTIVANANKTLHVQSCSTGVKSVEILNGFVILVIFKI